MYNSQLAGPTSHLRYEPSLEVPKVPFGLPFISGQQDPQSIGRIFTVIGGLNHDDDVTQPSPIVE